MIDSIRLKDLMTHTGYTYDTLSDAALIPKETLRSYADGRSDIPSEKLIRIADIFECPTDFLLGRTDNIDTSDVVRFRNVSLRQEIETRYKDRDISVLKKRGHNNQTGVPSKEDAPIAVWPYNLLQDIFCYDVTEEGKEDSLEDHLTIPVSKDQEDGLMQALSMLSEREQEIIRYRYEDCLTLDEVGQKYGITRVCIRQSEVKALRKLRHPARKNLIIKGLKAYSMEKEEMMLKGREAKLDELSKKVEKKEKEMRKAGIYSDMPKVQTDMISLDDLSLSVRSYNTLRRQGISTVALLLEYVKEHGKNWTRMRNLGPKSIDEIVDKVCAVTGLDREFFLPSSDKTS